MLKSVDVGPLGSEEFRGTAGLGRGPDTLDWATLSGLTDLDTSPTKLKKSIFTFDRIAPPPAAPVVGANDEIYNSVHTQSMNDITREEFNAKLETIEAKMDARVESVSAKIEGFLAAQAERDKRLDGVLAQIGKDNGETKAGISSMKTTLIVAAVSTVIAIVLGVAGFNTALTSNMLSAFQLGKSESTATVEKIILGESKSSPAATSPPAVKSGS